MHKVIGTEKIQDFFDELNFRKFDQLKGIHILYSNDADISFHQIILELNRTNIQPKLSMKVKFDQVKKINLRDFGGSLSMINGLDYRNVESHGLEKITWEIFDYENNQISFLCNSIEIIEFISDVN